MIQHVMALGMLALTTGCGNKADIKPPSSPGGSTDSADACGDGVCSAEEGASVCCADCGVCEEAATVTMRTGVVGGEAGAGVTPGGMAAMSASFPQGTYDRLTFPFTVVEEPPGDTEYFWAQQFWFDGGDGGYLGLQDNGLIEGAWAGKIAIFSIWDTFEATPGEGASCERFGGEGVGASCRRVLDWQEDTTYTFTISSVGDRQWSVEVFDPRAGASLPLGIITVPEGWAGLSSGTNAFAEYYGTTDSCEATPLAEVLIHMPTADAVQPDAISYQVYGTCASVAEVSCTGALCN